MGRVAYFDGDAETARHLGEQSLAAGREVGDDWLVGWALHLLALAAHIAGDYPHARALYEESIAVRQPLGYLEGIGICWSLLALLTYSEGDYHAARGFVRESLGALPEVALYPIPTVLATATSIAARLGQPRRAARLAGATAAFSESVDIVPIPLAEPILSEGQEMARRALGEAEYDAAWAEGRALSLDGAIDEGLADDVPPDELPARTDVHRLGEAPASLTEREAAVLRLIAAGRTTKEIAAELFVSVPTVERHITHLYGKIGARGRADATAYALQHGLAE
jgi:DNA-binding CsgD family transcriptional regulator